MNAYEKVKKIIEVNKRVDCQTLVPCLYGTSGTGKTTRVQQLAEELGLPLRVILLHSSLPEEVLGIPRVIDGKTVWSIPDWVMNEPAIYFFDELDKVREEELATILTLFASKTIRNYPLPKGSVIIAGMQPIEPELWTMTQTGKALIARMIFVPVTESEAFNYVSQKTGWDFSWIKTNDKIELPLIPPTPRQMEYCAKIFSFLTKSEWEEIVSGILPKEFKDVLVQTLGPRFLLTAEELAEALNTNPSLAEEIDIPVLVENAGAITQLCKPHIVARIEERILTNCPIEEWVNFHKKRFDYLYQKIEESPEKAIDIYAGADCDEVFESYQVVVERLIDYFEEVKKQEKKRETKKGASK
ncbi:MAG: AAA family ATPase [Bacteroidota bacterium]